MTTKTDHPKATIPIPDSAFHQLTAAEQAPDQPYYRGYLAGRKASAVLPSPAGSRDYDTYRSWVEPFLLPPAISGFVKNENVGYNNAMIDGANWLWTNDPQSPHKIPPD